jgi:methyl-accepting chemotaxis protein
LNIGLSVVVIILLVGNSSQLQDDYNKMLDKIFIANEATKEAALVYRSFNKVTEQRDSSGVAEGEEHFALYQEHMNYILSFAVEGEMRFTRIQINYDSFISDVNAYLAARISGDVAAESTAYEGLKATKDLIKTQMDGYIIGEIEKSTETKVAIQDSFQATLFNVIIIFVVGFLITLFTVIYVSRYISGGLKKLSKGAVDIGNGDLSVDLVRINSRDELNQLSEAFRIMQENLKTIVHDQITMSGQISLSTTELLSNTDEANEASIEIADSVAAMIDKMTNQKDKMKNIQEQIGDITEKTGEIHDISSKAKAEAIRSLDAVKTGETMIESFVVKMGDIKGTTEQTKQSIDNLVKVAGKMNGILESMNGISDQTTLLSLNASIEAARAGTEGRSFGVVAQEIRKLAENSAALGDDIGKMIKSTQTILKQVDGFINGVQDKVTESEGINHEVAKSFGHIKIINQEVDVNNKSIDQRVEDLSKLCANIETASNETYELVQENQSYSESISAAVQEEVATFEEIKEYVVKLDGLAESSKGQMSRFKL